MICYFILLLQGLVKEPSLFSPAAALGRMAPASCPGSIVELALDVGVAGELVPRV